MLTEEIFYRSVTKRDLDDDVTDESNSNRIVLWGFWLFSRAVHVYSIYRLFDVLQQPTASYPAILFWTFSASSLLILALQRFTRQYGFQSLSTQQFSLSPSSLLSTLNVPQAEPIPLLLKQLLHGVLLFVIYTMFLIGLNRFAPFRVVLFGYAEHVLFIIMSTVLGWSRKQTMKARGLGWFIIFIAILLVSREHYLTTDTTASDQQESESIAASVTIADILLPSGITGIFSNGFSIIVMTIACGLSVIRKKFVRKISDENNIHTPEFYIQSLGFGAVALAPIMLIMLFTNPRSVFYPFGSLGSLFRLVFDSLSWVVIPMYSDLFFSHELMGGGSHFSASSLSMADHRPTAAILGLITSVSMAVLITILTSGGFPNIFTIAASVVLTYSLNLLMPGFNASILPSAISSKMKQMSLLGFNYVMRTSGVSSVPISRFRESLLDSLSANRKASDSSGSSSIASSSSGSSSYSESLSFLPQTMPSNAVLAAIMRAARKITRFVQQMLASSETRAVFIFLTICTAFTIVEFVYGYIQSCLALIAHSLHALFESSALYISLFATTIAKTKPDKSFTYGYGRYEVLSSFISQIAFAFCSLHLLFVSLFSLFDCATCTGHHTFALALLRAVLTLIGVLFIRKPGIQHTGRQSTASSASVQLASEMFSSMLLVLLTIVAHSLRWSILEPIFALVVSALIIAAIIPQLKNTLFVLLQRVPIQSELSLKCTVEELERLDGVVHVYNAHFWCQDPQTMIGSLHVRVQDHVDEQRLLKVILGTLRARNVTDLTVQIEKQAFKQTGPIDVFSKNAGVTDGSSNV